MEIILNIDLNELDDRQKGFLSQILDGAAFPMKSQPIIRGNIWENQSIRTPDHIKNKVKWEMTE